MALSKESLALLKYVQEKKEVSLLQMAKHFHKKENSIRRQIYDINEYLSKEYQLEIKQAKITNTLSYKEYIDFIETIEYLSYVSNKRERQDIIIMLAAFQQTVNLTNLYQELGYSLTTKKQDTKELDTFLQKQQLVLQRIHRKGISIGGSELRFRMLLIKVLLPLIEVNSAYEITNRKANTPYERYVLTIFLEQYAKIEKFSKEYIKEFITTYQLHPSYASKKVFLLYLSITILRRNQNPITIIEETGLVPLEMPIFSTRYENIACNQVISMLDFDVPLSFPMNVKLRSVTEQFLLAVEPLLPTRIYTYTELLDKLYSYLYKRITSSFFAFTLPDKMVRGTREEYPDLYQKVLTSSEIIKKHYRISFIDTEITTLVLIIKQELLKNEKYGEGKKKVLIVTNTVYERIHFFIETLQRVIEVEIVDVLDINEIENIHTIDYEYIFTFSDRIQEILQDLSMQSIKLNFYITNSDITKLLALGFKQKSYIFIAEEVTKQLVNHSESEMIRILKEQYPDMYL